MKKLCVFACMISASLLALATPSLLPAATETAAVSPRIPDLLAEEEYDEEGEAVAEEEIFDPLEPWNRGVYVFNDKLYVWVLNPVRDVYKAAVPQDIRGCIGNFVSNLSAPVVLVNTLLQGRFADAWTVMSRFGINTVLGVYGFGDPAASEFDMAPPSADFGQTLGRWGAVGGPYLYWPLFGPANVRDTVGLVADNMAHPVNFMELNSSELLGYTSGTFINRLTLVPDIQEEIKTYSLDPYVATRQAYYDYRNSRINGRRQPAAE
ncbi:MAG: VacJ family lipoprotein [Desulfobulbaceae bacterium]|nr:MAG: VacJ family lipoprotein [Desulfobulbaceae bacterium]